MNSEFSFWNLEQDFLLLGPPADSRSGSGRRAVWALSGHPPRSIDALPEVLASIKGLC